MSEQLKPQLEDQHTSYSAPGIVNYGQPFDPENPYQKDQIQVQTSTTKYPIGTVIQSSESTDEDGKVYINKKIQVEPNRRAAIRYMGVAVLSVAGLVWSWQRPEDPLNSERDALQSKGGVVFGQLVKEGIIPETTEKTSSIGPDGISVPISYQAHKIENATNPSDPRVQEVREIESRLTQIDSEILDHQGPILPKLRSIVNLHGLLAPLLYLAFAVNKWKGIEDFRELKVSKKDLPEEHKEVPQEVVS